MSKLTFNTVAREICKREKSESREVNITDVKRVMRHLFDIVSEERAIIQLDNGVTGDFRRQLSMTWGRGLTFIAAEIDKRWKARLDELTRKSRRPDKRGGEV